MPEASEQPIDPLEQEPIFVDVSWDSEDERLDRAIEVLSRELYPNRIRPDLLANNKKHLRPILAIFTRAFQTNPSYPITIPRNNSFGTPSYQGSFDPYNPKRYKFKKIRSVLDQLISYGFLTVNIGRQDFFSNGYEGRASRYNTTQAFKDFIQSHELDNIEFEKILINGGMVIKNTKTAGAKTFKRFCYDYGDIPAPHWLAQSIETLDRYNALIKQSDIGLTQQVSEQVIDILNKTSWRIFNENSYELGGRFYGGWWTYCKKKNRPYITINGEETVEYDYTANHLYWFYGLRNTEIPEDLKAKPYELDNEIPKDVFKMLITRGFNCTGEYGIINHLRTVLKENKAEHKKDITLIKRYMPTPERQRELLDIVYDKHPILRQATDSNEGMKLMNWDSKVAEYVLNTMTNLNIPTLCIHDSFIAPNTHKNILKNTMNEAYEYLSIPLSKPPIKEVGAVSSRLMNT